MIALSSLALIIPGRLNRIMNAVVPASLVRGMMALGSLAADQVDIKVQYCGICHSDLSMLNNELGFTQYPFVPGQEPSGETTAKVIMWRNLRGGKRLDSGGSREVAWLARAV